MDGISAFKKMIEGCQLRKAQICSMVGASSQALNSALHAKGIGSDKLASYAVVCGFRLVLVPEEEAGSLSEDVIFIDGPVAEYAVEVLGADDGTVELGAFRTEKEAYSFLADYQSKHAGDFLRVVKREVPR